MEPIIIKPLVSIGSIQLGMDQSQVQTECKNFPLHNAEDLFSKIEYDSNHKLVFIEAWNPFGEFDIELLYDGIDLFKTKADDIINRLSQQTEYMKDDESDMRICFTFKELGLSFWRPDSITEDIVNSSEFLNELTPEIQEYEKRNLYFSTVALASPSYFE